MAYAPSVVLHSAKGRYLPQRFLRGASQVHQFCLLETYVSYCIMFLQHSNIIHSSGVYCVLILASHVTVFWLMSH